MEKHNHEWHLIDPDDRDVITAECFWGWEESGYKIQCPAILDEAEINRRINAVDKLSADQAMALDDFADHPNPAVKGSGYAYAAALEKE